MNTPWHVWVIGVLSLVWNAGGAYDYLMTQTDNQTYLAMLNEAQRAFLTNVPVWFEAFWALGVWGSILGSIMLLMRSRLAALSFAVSGVSMIATVIYSWGIANPSAIEISGTFSIVFSLLIMIVIAALWYYARAMTARGVLR